MWNNDNSSRTGLEIAIIGMAGRFPGSNDIGEFWTNLLNGKENITIFPDKELIDAGVDAELIKNPNYVKAKGYLHGIDYFDSEFFKYSDSEGKLMDPQIRLFHENVWSALEDAGYVPDTYNGLIGLYGGATNCIYWELLSFMNSEKSDIEQFAVEQLNNKDYMCTRISYKLNLKGPSLFVQSGCSTSLVAINMACKALLTGECNIAVAGGVNLCAPYKSGYMYHEGLIYSRDGHCRAFDENSSGFVPGDGVGSVVLKPLKQALADRDNIYAIIKGSAINNDGIRKVGFTAPSVEGQAEVIKSALRMAKVSPESISYVETHGTGTALGDPIEIEGLKLAFNTDKKEFCRIGSVKTNIGHLDSAAGVASFIKAALCLKNRLIPPYINFERPNPKLDLKNSPFYIHTGLSQWENEKYPLRVGVSSFGVGGTNAHTILEEAPQREALQDESGPKLIILSAKTGEALNKAAQNQIRFLRENPDINMSDLAYTLQVGRKSFSHKLMLVCSTAEEAIGLLEGGTAGDIMNSSAKKDERKSVVFLFTGQGSQYINMGLELYNTEPAFRQEIDRCFEILKNISACDMKDILYPQNDGSEIINQTEFAQPLIFSFEYALAKLLMKWGITPYAMIGHSIGEYVAACLAGVFSLEDALKVVVERGRLIQKMPRGSMVSIPSSEDKVRQLLNDRLSLAVVNEKCRCVVGGTFEDIESFERKLAELGYDYTRLHTSHAFHSYMMDPILDEFKEKLEQVQFSKPAMPYISNISGKWVTVEEATSPEYWVRHLRETVRFFDGISELLTGRDHIFVEVGAGNTLSNFVRNHTNRGDHSVVSIVRHPKDTVSDRQYLLRAIGRLWIEGIEINWTNFNDMRNRYRISLPTYPFNKKHYRTDGDPLKMMALQGEEGKKQPIQKWFNTPVWKRSALPKAGNREDNHAENIMIFADHNGIGEKLQKSLSDSGNTVLMAKAGNMYEQLSDKTYGINAGCEEDYDKLFNDINNSGITPDKIIYLFGLGAKYSLQPDDIASLMDTGFYSLINIAKAMKRNDCNDTQIIVITDSMYMITGSEAICPQKALILGPAMIIGNEYPGIRCRSIDIIIPEKDSSSETELIKQLSQEVRENYKDGVLAYRNGFRWIQGFEPIEMEKPQQIPPLLKDRGVYLITGGLGGIGLTLAHYIVKAVKGKVILLSRSKIPSKQQWKQWLEEHDVNDETSGIIHIIKKLESLGGEVMTVSADVSDIAGMREAIDAVVQRFGKINGVIHAAGIPDGGLIEMRTRELTEKVMAPKVKGTIVLNNLLEEHKLDFFVLCSSLASLIPEIGEVAYVGANAFLDAFASYRNSKDGTFAVSINWDEWSTVGMAVKSRAAMREALGCNLWDSESHNQAILPDEGAEAFERILEGGLSQVAVSTANLAARLKENKEKFSIHGSNRIKLFETHRQDVKEQISQESFYTFSWQQQDISQKIHQHTGMSFIVFTGESTGLELSFKDTASSQKVVFVRHGTGFEKTGENEYTIHPQRQEDYDLLIRDICCDNVQKYAFVYLCDCIESNTCIDEKSLLPLSFLAQSLEYHNRSEMAGIEVVSVGAANVMGTEGVSLEKAQIMGAVKYIAEKYPGVRCLNIDIGETGEFHDRSFVEKLGTEMLSMTDGIFVAYRGGKRFVLKHTPAVRNSSMKDIRLKEGGTYFIAGGLDGVGYMFAKSLIGIKDVKLVIAEHVSLQTEETAQYCSEYEIPDRKRKNAAELEKYCVKIIQSTSLENIDTVLNYAGIEVGDVNGIILTPDFIEGMKMSKLYSLEEKLQSYPFEFVILCSVCNNPLEWPQALAQYRIESIYNALAARLRDKEIYTVAASLDGNDIADYVPQICSLTGTGRTAEFFYEKIVADGKDRTIYISKLSTQNNWILNEHRIAGKAVFPVTGYLEMVIAALELYSRKREFELSDVYFIEPLVLDETEVREVRTVIEKKDGVFEFSIISFSGPQSNEWYTHAVGKIAFVGKCKSEKHDIHGIQRAFDGTEIVMGEKPYKEFGPRWSSIQHVKHGIDEGIAFLKLPERYLTDERNFVLHPALLDCATGFMMDYIEGSHLPFSYKRIRVNAPLKGEIFSYIKRVEADDDSIAFDIIITDKEGNEQISIEGFALRTINTNEPENGQAEDKKPEENYSIAISSPGLLNTLEFRQSERIQPVAGCVEIEVQEVGLNFKDVLLVVNPYADSDSKLDIGMECVGRITALGEGVESFSKGEEVIAIGSGLFSRFAVVPEYWLIRKPEEFNLEQAATTYGVFTAAYHSLINLGRLSKGEKVLIHTATGGVGLAAVQIAKIVGAEIFATAGSEEKREYLRSLGIKHVMNSRTVEFADEINNITGGKGVDVVLNSLGGGNFISSSLSVLAPFGRFIELGKQDIIEGKKIEMSLLEKGISFIVVDVGPETPVFRELVHRISQHFEKEDFQPLNVKVFQACEVSDAFEFMAAAAHIGKIAVSLKENTFNRRFGAPKNSGVISSRTVRDIPDPGYLKSILEYAGSTVLVRKTGFENKDINIRMTGAAEGKSRNNNTIESELLKVFNEMLGLKGLNVNDNFFESGVDSLTLVRAYKYINSVYPGKLAVHDMFSCKTISKLAEAIKQKDLAESETQERVNIIEF